MANVWKLSRSKSGVSASLHFIANVLLIASVSILGQHSSAVNPGATSRSRRVLYNLDGDSCMTTRAGAKEPVAVTEADLERLVEEIAYDGSQVDTLLLCINAQVMYYPTKVGTLRGTASTPEERANWPARERQRFETLQRFFDAGVDPYAVVLSAMRQRGREALLSFRMNDDHGNDFLRTRFRIDHPDYTLGAGALDFGQEAVREYVFRLIEEAVARYDCDGVELDFNRFPRFVRNGTTDERMAKMDSLVERVRHMVDAQGKRRGRRLVLAVRVPSNFGRSLPTPGSSKELGCDIAGWVERGWVDFVSVSEFLHEQYNLPLADWKRALPKVPVYGGIECTEGSTEAQYLTADKYRRAALRLWKGGGPMGSIYSTSSHRANMVLMLGSRRSRCLLSSAQLKLLRRPNAGTNNYLSPRR